MPTKDYADGFANGYRAGLKDAERGTWAARHRADDPERFIEAGRYFGNPKPKKRKLSGWQKFVKDNAKKPRFKYKSGAKKGRINLKALGVAYRKKRR